MESCETNIKGVLVVKPDVYRDERGFFTETYSKKRYSMLGIKEDFVQDNYSFSVKGTLRGLHYQLMHPQAKLVRVLKGEVFDVAVDLRRESPTFGNYFSLTLSDTNLYQLFMPAGIAHGFFVLSESAHFEYKCSEYYYAKDQHGLLWNDETVNINWPSGEVLLSDQDSNFVRLSEKRSEDLPVI